MSLDFVDADVKLRNGRSVHIRLMRPSDEAELLQAFDRLSPDARYMRFMRTVREPNIDRLRTTLASFPESGIGIVATVPATDGIDIVGSAICVLGGSGSHCEFAISVVGGWEGAGLGGALMRTIIEAAKRRGLTDMEGFVLAENKPMLALATRLGFSVARDPDDPAIRICHLTLADR